LEILPLGGTVWAVDFSKRSGDRAKKYNLSVFLIFISVA